MKRLLTFTYLVLCTTFLYAQLTFLSRSTPEQEGLLSADMLAFLDTVMTQKDTDVHGLMVLRNGKVIAEKYNEPWAAQYGHTLYSCSKTFTGVAVGLAIEDSLLTLDTRLVDILPDMMPDSIAPGIDSITVEHLLTMTPGFPVDTRMRTVQNEWVKAYCSQVLASPPGTLFAYDSIDSYLLSAMVQRVYGRTILQLLRERIFTPLGITQVYWEESPEGISCGGWGLYMQLESMAKFGQLLLQKGNWEGQQLIAQEWIEQMMQPCAGKPGSDTRYGYHIWIMPYPGMVRCDGAYGQYIIVIPDRQMVVAMTQCMRGTGALEFQSVWNLSRKAQDRVMPVKSKDQLLLTYKVYSLPHPQGEKRSRKHFLLPVKLKLAANSLGWKQVELSYNPQSKRAYPILDMAVTTQKNETYTLQCGFRHWMTSEIKGLPLNFRPFRGNFRHLPSPYYAAGSYAWLNDNTLVTSLQYVNWLSAAELRLLFDNQGQVTIKLKGGQTNKYLSIKTSLVR